MSATQRAICCEARDDRERVSGVHPVPPARLAPLLGGALVVLVYAAQALVVGHGGLRRDGKGLGRLGQVLERLLGLAWQALMQNGDSHSFTLRRAWGETAAATATASSASAPAPCGS
jgi:hypothetical protein